MDPTTLENLNNNLNSIQVYLEGKWSDQATNKDNLKECFLECMEIIAGSKEIEEFFTDLSKRKLLNTGACETTWSFGDTAYKCKTCQLDPTSALCIACFKQGDHEGHDYSLQSVGGGFCDCGDPTSFKSTGFCTRHKEQKMDISKYPQRFILALCYVIQFVLKKIVHYFEQTKVEEYEGSMDWLLKLAQRGDIVKVIVIKYISNTNIGNSHLLPPSPFTTPLLQLFFAPDKEKSPNTAPKRFDNKEHRMKETFGNFCVFLRGSLEFIESFIRIILPIYKDCLINSKRHILLSSYSIFSSTAMSSLLLTEDASEIVMDTATEFFSKYMYDRASLYHTVKKIRMKEPYNFPQFKYITMMPSIPPQLNTVRTDINFILSNPAVSSHVISTPESLSLWFNMVGLSQGMNPNVKYMPIIPNDWISAFTLDIAFSHSIFYIVNSLPLHKATLDQALLFSSQYLGKWILGWLESRSAYLLEKQNKLLEANNNNNNNNNNKETPPNSYNNLILKLKLDPQNLLKNFKEILQVPIKRDGFSFHLPLHRIVSAIVHRCFSNLSSDYATAGGLNQLFTQVIGGGSLISVAEYGKASSFHPLSIIAALGEIKSGMWKSHAREEDMTLQAIMYQSLHYQKYFDLDIFLIQIGAILMGPNEFIKHSLSIYQLAEFFKFERPEAKEKDSKEAQAPPTPSKSLRHSSGSVKTSSESDKEKDKDKEKEEKEKEKEKEDKKLKKEKERKEEEVLKKKTLTEDYLQSLIMITSNKMLCGMTDEQIIRKEIIHRLCLADVTHSQLTRNIKSKYVNHPQFEAILKEIAVFHQPQKTEQGKYQLKESCWTEFDSYFPHYNTQDLQTAEERYSEFVNKTKTNIARGLFLSYPTFHGFEDLNSLLCSKELHQILFTILQNQLVGSSKSSDTLLGHALNALELLIIQTLNSNVKNQDLEMLNQIVQQQQKEKEKENKESSGPSTPSKSKSSSLNSSIEVTENFADVPFPSERNIFVNSVVQVQISESKKLSLLILLVKLTTSNQVNAEPKIQIQNIINCLMENNPICKQTVENYLSAIKAKKQPAGKGKEDPEEEKKRIARARQAAILAQMKTQQSAFKFDDVDDDDYEDELPKGKKEEKKVNSNALNVDGCENVTTCALCREAGSLTRPMGRVAFIQPSSILMLSKLTPEERKQRITSAVLKELGGIEKLNGDKPTTTAAQAQQGIHDLFGQEMDEDIEDVDMGEDDDEDTDDEVSKALSFLTKISSHSDFADLGFGDDMNLDQDDDDIMDLNELGIPGGAAVVRGLGHRLRNNLNNEDEDDSDDFEFRSDEEDNNDDDDDDDKDDDDDDNMDDIINHLNDDDHDGQDIEIDYSMGDDSDDDIIDYDDDDDDESDGMSEGDYQEVNLNQNSQLFRFITEFVQQHQQNQQNQQANPNPSAGTANANANAPTGAANANRNQQSLEQQLMSFNIPISLLAGTSAASAGTLNNVPTGENTNANQTGTRRVMFQDRDNEIEVENEEDSDSDENPYFGDFSDSEDENVVKKFDDFVEPVQGFPWSDKFSRQEIFRNIEESVNLHLSFCGHQIHEDCFSEYSWSVIKNNNFEGEDLIDPNKNEFLCVLCRRIGNAIVPVIPDSGFKNTDTMFQQITDLKTIFNQSQPGQPYKEFLDSLRDKLTKPVVNNEPTPEAIKKVRPAIDQFAARIHGVRYDLNFYRARSDSVVTPYLCSSLSSTISNTELAIRTPDIDPTMITQQDYPLFTMNDAHRIDIRSLYRVIVAHSFAHSPQDFEGNLLWNSISGGMATPLPSDYDKILNSESETNEKEKEMLKVDSESFPPLLSLNLFHTFVQVLLRYSDTDLNENLKKFYRVARLFYDATITQSIYQHFKTIGQSEEDKSGNDSFTKTINMLITNQQSINSETFTIPPEHLQSIKTNSLIFLRRASLFLFACLKIDAPTLNQQQQQMVLTNLENEVDYLVNYLQLPAFNDHCYQILSTLVNHNENVPLVNTWSEQLLSAFAIETSNLENNNSNNNSQSSTTTTTTSTTTSTPSTPPNTQLTTSSSSNQLALTNSTPITSILPSPIIPKSFLLIKLPDLYNTLTQYYSSIPCIQCKTVSSTQALCLICGTLCCLGGCCKRFYDQKNECILHAERCNAGTCMFLVIKSSSILLVHLPRKTIWISPYLDDHGEEDPNLRRGKPLYLNSNRYYQLNALLLKHQIDQDSKIAELSTRDI